MYQQAEHSCCVASEAFAIWLLPYYELMDDAAHLQPLPGFSADDLGQGVCIKVPASEVFTGRDLAHYSRPM